MLYRKSTLAALLALIFFSFFGTLTVSAWIFPKKLRLAILRHLQLAFAA